MTTTTIPVPPRGSSILPTWIRLDADGWACDHPHENPVTPCAADRLPAHQINRSAIDHLDAHHPGWKLPCRHCKRPQWNEVGSTYCYDCRPR